MSTRLSCIILLLVVPTLARAEDTTPEVRTSPDAQVPKTESLPEVVPSKLSPEPSLDVHTVPTLADATREDLMSNARRLEFSVFLETSDYTSSSLEATSRDASQGSPGISVGYGLNDAIVLSVGWRSLIAMNRSDLGYDLSTSGDALLLTGRYDYPVTRWLSVSAELDVEVLGVDYDLEVGGRSGTTTTWGLGAVPKLMLLSRFDLGPANLDLRAYAGYALRTTHDPDALILSSAADRVAPVALGTLDLQAFVSGLTVALSF